MGFACDKGLLLNAKIVMWIGIERKRQASRKAHQPLFPISCSRACHPASRVATTTSPKRDCRGAKHAPITQTGPGPRMAAISSGVTLTQYPLSRQVPQQSVDSGA